MKTTKHNLSDLRIMRIREQGYFTQSNQEIIDLAFGNRFAYRLCASILTIGVITASIPMLTITMSIAFLTVVLPNHPFDYIYNFLLSGWFKKPKLPPRSIQLKFACTLATFWVGTTIYLFFMDKMLAGYIMGSGLIAVAAPLSLIDLCIPSKIFNAIMLHKVNTSKA